MRVMTGGTGAGCRVHLLMGRGKRRRTLVMALHAERPDRLPRQGRLVGAMSGMTGRAIIGRGVFEPFCQNLAMSP